MATCRHLRHRTQLHIHRVAALEGSRGAGRAISHGWLVREGCARRTRRALHGVARESGIHLPSGCIRHLRVLGRRRRPRWHAERAARLGAAQPAGPPRPGATAPRTQLVPHPAARAVPQRAAGRGLAPASCARHAPSPSPSPSPSPCPSTSLSLSPRPSPIPSPSPSPSPSPNPNSDRNPDRNPDRNGNPNPNPNPNPTPNPKPSPDPNQARWPSTTWTARWPRPRPPSRPRACSRSRTRGGPCSPPTRPARTTTSGRCAAARHASRGRPSPPRAGATARDGLGTRDGRARPGHALGQAQGPAMPLPCPYRAATVPLPRPYHAPPPGAARHWASTTTASSPSPPPRARAARTWPSCSTRRLVRVRVKV